MSTWTHWGRWPLAASLAGIVLNACTVGPDFHRPTAPTPAVIVNRPPVGEPSRPVERKLAAAWWTLFQDPLLNEMEFAVASSSLDVAAASARLRQSRAGLRIAGASALPSLGAAGSYYREQASPNGVLALVGVTPTGSQPQSADGTAPFGVAAVPGSNESPPYNLFQYGFDASWELDLWGRTRRGLEAAEAAKQASFEDRNVILLSVQAELARDYIDLRTAQALKDIADKNLDIARDEVALARLRVEQGVATRLDLANASAQVAQIQADLPALATRCDVDMNAISALLGQLPGAFASQLDQPASIPRLPARVPVGFPSELVRRRPDIRLAEARLHEATAAIGMAQADFYPQISLTGSAGAQSLQLSNLGDWASHQFVVGPSISLPIFEGGRLTGTLALRRAQQQEAAILFRRTVLDAWRDVDDALSAYRSEQQRRDRLEAVVGNDRLALSIAQQRYREGAIDYLDVLSVQKSLLDAEQELAQSNSMAAVNLVALCKSLGGGWQAVFSAPDVPNARATNTPAG